MNKSLLTNITALLLIALSYTLTAPYAEPLRFMGVFALSGALTNWLAIYMIFNKVPFLYGSGVIEENFTGFKHAIKEMVIEQFFTKEKLENFGSLQVKELERQIEKLDLSSAFDALSQTVLESKFGSALQLFGGTEALETLREPFEEKLKRTIVKIIDSKRVSGVTSTLTQSMQESLLSSVEAHIEVTLEALTPTMVKTLVHQLIKEHLSWLVVWGGAFGGVIGLMSVTLL